MYSTCSLNPVEDEAVLYRMLVDAADSVKLVDVSDKVKGLKYTKGIKKWKVGGKEKGNLWSDFQDVPEAFYNQLRPYMFAPSSGVEEKYNIDRCLRILPHQQNTGGFFVAVIQKDKLCPWESQWKSSSANAAAAAEGNDEEKTKPPAAKKPRFFGYKEDPYQYFDEREPAFEEVKEYFDIKVGIC